MPTKKTATKGGKKASATKSAKPAKPAAKAAKKAPAKPAAATKKKAEGGKAKAKANGAEAKPAKATTKSGAASRDAAAAATKRDGAKKGKGESQRSKAVIPWAQRFKDDTPGPWTCPSCGPLPQRAQPLYGEDERHHCPNLDCDKVVTLLSKEDLEPAEKRGSWPPQRNKNRTIPAAGASEE